MKLSKMLNEESKVIAKNSEVGKRSDCTDILISARFNEDHLHHILPSQQITDEVVFDLLSYMTLKKEIVSSVIVKMLTNYIELNDKEDSSFDEMIKLIGEIKDKLKESKEINKNKGLKVIK